MQKTKHLLLWATLFFGGVACSAPVDEATLSPDGAEVDSVGQGVVDPNNDNAFTMDVHSTNVAHEYTAAIAWLRSRLTTGMLRGTGQTPYVYPMLLANPPMDDAHQGDAELLQLHLWQNGGNRVTIIIRRDNGYIVGYVLRPRAGAATNPFTSADTFYYTNDFGPSNARGPSYRQRRNLSGTQNGGLIQTERLPFGGAYAGTGNLINNAGQERHQTPLTRNAVESVAVDLTHGPSHQRRAQAILQWAILFGEGARFNEIQHRVETGWRTDYNSIDQDMATETNQYAAAGAVIRQNLDHNGGTLTNDYTLGAHVIHTILQMSLYMVMVHQPAAGSGKP